MANQLLELIDDEQLSSNINIADELLSEEFKDNFGSDTY